MSIAPNLYARTKANSIQIQDRPDVVIDLKSPGALESLKNKPFTIKEGATFRMKARFKVQHQILSGMKYIQVVKRMGISNKMQEMIVGLDYITNWDDRSLLRCSNLF